VLLFSPRARAIYRLNPSAAFIWCCCEEGLDRPAIAREMMQAFQLPAGRAEQDLEATLSDWETRGLLGYNDEPPSAPAESAPGNDETFPEPRALVRAFPLERRYRLLDTAFRLRFADAELMSCAQAAFAHLAADAHGPFDLSLDVQRDAAGFFLLRDGQAIAWCKTVRELTPLLHGQLVADAYAHADSLITLHAAAVSNGHECLVFPALSGSGKSTLTAALVAAGFKYCTDELVLVQALTHRVRAIAAAIGIKPGSWAVLEAFHPEIANLATHLRVDGQQVRYLLPDPGQLTADPAQHHPVRALVFPVYGANTATRLTALTPADALCRLTDAGTDVAGGLDEGRVAELVDWIGGVNSYELRYGNLQEAITQVRELLP
jgi:Coenzyme PQQ synthesis protein D (PqqD)